MISPEIAYFYCMLKLKNSFFAVVLLLSFTALVVPKSWWHDCDHGFQHASISKTEHGKHFKQGYEKCAACDLQMPLLHQPEQPLTVAIISSIIEQPNASFQGALHAVQFSTHSRGPPVKMT